MVFEKEDCGDEEDEDEEEVDDDEEEGDGSVDGFVAVDLTPVCHC